MLVSSVPGRNHSILKVLVMVRFDWQIPGQRKTKMATYYPNVSEPPHLPGNMMYLNQASGGPFSEFLSGSSVPVQDYVQIPSIGAREELEFISPLGESGNADQHSRLVSRAPMHIVDGEQTLSSQGLSLRLGTQIPSAVHASYFENQFTDPKASFFLSSHVQAQDVSQSKGSRSDEYLAYNLPGRTPDAIKMGFLDNSYCPIEMHSNSHLYEPPGPVSNTFNPKYLKVAQELLDEVVCVQNALKELKTDKQRRSHKFGVYESKDIGKERDESSSDPHESTANSSSELSQSERQDLQNKLTRLSSMLDEVDRKYRQYYHQMQVLISSFEMVAGRGAAKTYTSLARQRISRHFRSLRDAIDGQIRVTRQRLGEQDAINGQGGLPRLRYVDQQLRQQRAIGQFGAMRHSWRPQRGLPESSVSILRAWLFEHFLHPYPKDSEKLMLARQTGLTRGQVANWFINARVRLWKPMIEEMYKEEFGELDSKSSPDDAPKAARDKSRTSVETGEEGAHMGQLQDSKPEIVPEVTMQGCPARLGFQSGACGDNGNDRRPNVDNYNLSEDGFISTNQTGADNSVTAYSISELGTLSVGKQVSLALGLRHLEASTTDHDTADYHYMDLLNQEHKITNPHTTLPDFVL